MTANGEQLLADLRPTTFAVAYRMLGSVATAEDVVQETLLRVHEAIETGRRSSRRGRSRRPSPRGCRSTSCGRRGCGASTTSASGCPSRCSATPRPTDPARRPSWPTRCRWRSSSSSRALSPEQRAALLLHDVFDYGYDEVAEIVGTSVDNARQLATRARRRSPSSARASIRRRSSARSSRTASSRRRATAISRASRRCWPTTSCCTATAAARSRRSRGRCAAATASRARCGRGRARAFAPAASRSAKRSSTASRGRCSSTPTAASRGHGARHRRRPRFRQIRSIINPDKLAHLAG